jgi:3-methyladenine DNA glycosylase AlkD
MANLAVHDKKADNAEFIRFLNIVDSGAQDERNYVKKAVNWALRQIGKRNLELNKDAIDTANRILKLESKYSMWIASDALKELTGEKIRRRLETRD